MNELKENIEKLKKEFNEQSQYILKNDFSSFHDHLMEILAKYPEQKELIKFITFINDEFQRNNQTQNEIYSDTINKLFDKYIKITEKIDALHAQKPKSTNKFGNFFKNFTFKDLKFVIGGTILILLMLILLKDPTLIDKLFADVFKFFKML